MSCKAVVAGNPAAQNDLGTALLLGRGVEPDPNEAAKWLRKVSMR